MGLKVSDRQLDEMLGNKTREDEQLFMAAESGDKKAILKVRHWMNELKNEANERLRKLEKWGLDSFRNIQDIKNRLLVNGQTRFRNLGQLKYNFDNAYDEFVVLKKFLKMKSSDPIKADQARNRQLAYLQKAVDAHDEKILSGAGKIDMSGLESQLWRSSFKKNQTLILNFLHSQEVEDLIGIEGDSHKVVDTVMEWFGRAPEYGKDLIEEGIRKFMYLYRNDQIDKDGYEKIIGDVYDGKY